MTEIERAGSLGELSLSELPAVNADKSPQYAFSRIAWRNVIHRILKSSPSDQFSM